MSCIHEKVGHYMRIQSWMCLIQNSRKRQSTPGLSPNDSASEDCLLILDATGAAGRVLPNGGGVAAAVAAPPSWSVGTIGGPFVNPGPCRILVWCHMTCGHSFISAHGCRGFHDHRLATWLPSIQGWLGSRILNVLRGGAPKATV